MGLGKGRVGSRKKKLYKSSLSRLFLLAEVLDSPVEWLRTVIRFFLHFVGCEAEKTSSSPSAGLCKARRCCRRFLCCIKAPEQPRLP